MTFDPNCGHFQGAGGTARGFNPAQGAVVEEANPLLDGLQWYFRFDTGTGSFTDSVNGTVLSQTNAPTSETGVVGQAMGINDSDESRASSTASGLLTAASETANSSEGSNVAYPFTVMGWFYPEETGGYPYTGKYIVENNSSNMNWMIWSEPKWNDAANTFYFGVQGNGSIRYTNLGVVQSFDEWYCIVCIYYGVNHDETGSFQVSENAKRISLVTGSAGAGSISNTAFTAGYGEELQAGTELFFGAAPSFDINGRYDMVGRWNRVLSDEEILSFYNTSKGGANPI